MNNIQHCVVLTSQLATRIPNAIANYADLISAIERSDHPHFVYPDGSIEIEVDAKKSSIWSEILSRSRSCIDMVDIGFFREIPCFNSEKSCTRHYRIVSISDHQRYIGFGGMLLFAPAIGPHDYPDWVDPADLSMNVRFTSRISHAARTLLANTISSWALSVASSGVSGEGRVARISPQLEIDGRRAGFSFDASTTGQRTINYLILSILNSMYGKHKISTFVFDEIHNLSKYGFTDDGHAVFSIPLLAGLPKETQSPSSPAGMFDEIISCARYSQEIDVYKKSTFEWSSFSVAIFFDDPMNSEEAIDILRILDSWVVLGQYGGFGGQGFFNGSQVRIVNSFNAAYFSADLSETDYTAALDVLIRAIDNASRESRTVKFIILGLTIKIGDGPLILA